MAARRRRLLIPLAVAALAAFVVGIASGKSGTPGPLRWVGTPRVGAAGEQQVLYGTIVNRTKKPLRLSTNAVRVVDGNGKRLTSMAAFDGGYVAAGVVHPAETVVLRPAGRLPLSVTWSGGDGARVEAAGSKLSIPQ